MNYELYHMNIVPASQNSFTKAIRLLESCGLPTKDIHPGMQLFVVEQDDKVMATVAVEYDWEHALLRSLSVDENSRKKGMGEELVSFAENYVRQQGVQAIFILTTTAADFFSKRGYSEIERTDIPLFIQNTSEFSSTCPASATIMKKFLG